MELRTYSVPGMTCEHCRQAVTAELSSVPGVAKVDVDLSSKVVTVGGQDLADDVLRAAIAEAGYHAT